eukprot:4565536-Alexandrium_andersonii.AAC.1
MEQLVPQTDIHWQSTGCEGEHAPVSALVLVLVCACALRMCVCALAVRAIRVCSSLCGATKVMRNGGGPDATCKQCLRA